MRNPYELPPEQLETYLAARRLAVWTIAYLGTAGLGLYLAVGQSQAMRAAWLETVFSTVTPLVFVLGSEVARRPPDRRFPYGYSRWVSIAFLGAALTLFALGLYLLADAAQKLLASGDAAPARLGTVEVAGYSLWLGWPVLLALAWAALPAYALGRRQLARAALLHDKVLATDAKMREADWLTALAAAIGIVGLETGYTLLDPIAAAVIALNILKAGYGQLRHALADLADSAPMTIDETWDPLPELVRERLLAQPWVADARVRLREEGRLIFGDAFVVPRRDAGLTASIDQAVAAVHALDWRIASFAIMPVPPAALDSERLARREPTHHHRQVSVPT